VKAQSFVGAEKAAGHGVARACRLLKVSRAAYYQRRNSAPSARRTADAAITARIVSIHIESKGTYGSPRVHQALRRQDTSCGKRRVARLMRAAGLEGRRKKRWRTTTIADPAAERARDLIQRDFAPRPGTDQRYAGDITYIMTWEGWAYLATVIDLSSRRVVGWALADHMRTSLVEDALSMAFTTRRPAAGVIFHSDRGCQYTSKDYAALASANGVILSVSRKGECWDNAVAESFFATIKRELTNDQAWPTRTGLHRAVFDYIEGWYNTRRLHSALGYLSPAEYESAHHNAAPQAA
jgi:transposase InsO family protein